MSIGIAPMTWDPTAGAPAAGASDVLFGALVALSLAVCAALFLLARRGADRYAAFDGTPRRLPDHGAPSVSVTTSGS